MRPCCARRRTRCEPGIDELVMDEEALPTLYRALQEYLNNVAPPRKPSSFGLLDLHERVGGHGGSLVVKGARDHGTEVLVNIPLAVASAGTRLTSR